MKFLIVSHVGHKKVDDKYFAYGPFVKEMNLWLNHVSSVEVVAPLESGIPEKIDLYYKHENFKFNEVPSFNLIGFKNKILTFLRLPLIFFKLILAMYRADHIHLRCPGNMGLLGAMAQTFFPSKSKTVKYAGNWDPKSKQPKSFIFQKSIVSNTIFSKNIKVLVYGEWKNQTKNICPFFTASYFEREIEDVKKRDLKGKINLLFVGSLSKGKQPILALSTLKVLRDNGINMYLDFCGEGIERNKLEEYISDNHLQDYVIFHGNQNSEFVKKMYKKSHFLILMSKSEGWPKVVAESMFWGCVPICSNVSCVNFMLGYGSRGKVVPMKVENISKVIKSIVFDEKEYEYLSSNGINWSRKFTLESFEKEIKRILNE